jgi:hypothetical protein
MKIEGGYLIALASLSILGFLALRAKLLAAKMSRSIAAGDPVSGWRHALLAAESRLRKWRMESGPTAIAGWKGEAKRIRSLFETIRTLHPSVPGAQDDPEAVTAAWNTALTTGDRKSRAAATTLAEQYLAANRAVI